MDKEESKKKIAVGADHAGFELKKDIVKYLEDKGYDVIDVGTYTEDSVDYPDLAYKAAEYVSKKESEVGILVCGTGIGMSMVANKIPGVRAALCNSVESAKLSKAHNDANLLCIGSRLDNPDSTHDIIDAWLSTEFKHGRHERRVDKIHNLTGI